MVTAVLLIGLLNLGIGCAVAFLADSPWSLVLPSWSLRRTAAESSEPEHVESARSDDPTRLPSEWCDRLKAERIATDSEIEALLWMVYLDSIATRDSLLKLGEGDQSAQAEVAAYWIGSLEVWVELLADHKPDPDHGAFATDFEELLLDQQFQAKSVVDGLLAGDERRGQASNGSIPALFNTLDTVRDFTVTSLGVTLRDSGRVESVAEPWRIDEASDTLSRLGMEVLFHDWRKADEEGVRMASCVLVDIDRTSKINESIGPAATDQSLAAFGRLMKDLVRKERGFDRVARYRGDSYLLFFGDTAASSAANGAERIRQTVEASAFLLDGTAINLSATFAIAELVRNEPFATLLKRLEAGIVEAKAAGRNRTFVDSGSGPQPVTLPQYEVQRREIQVVRG